MTSIPRKTKPNKPVSVLLDKFLMTNDSSNFREQWFEYRNLLFLGVTRLLEKEILKQNEKLLIQMTQKV